MESATIERAQAATTEQAETAQKNMTLVVFSGDMDKLMAALSIATTAAAVGTNVTLFFTFWGISAIRKSKSLRGKGVLDRALNLMLPSRANKTQMSRMNMGGAGPRFFRHLMARKHVADVDELVATAQMLGIQLKACTMSMDVMGIDRSELIDGIEFAGATACVQDLLNSKATLFV